MCRIVKLKKAVLFTLIFTVLMFCTAVSAGADDSINSDYEDIYNEVYGIAGADTLTDALPNKVKRELKKAGVTAPRWEELNSLSFSEIMENIISEAGEQSVTPLNSLVKITGILIIAAFINSIKTTVASGALTGVLDCVSVLAVSIVLIRPLTDVIEYSSTVVKLSADFMFGGDDGYGTDCAVGRKLYCGYGSRYGSISGFGAYPYTLAQLVSGNIGCQRNFGKGKS